MPDVQVDRQGQTYISNDTLRELLVYNLEDSNVNDMPLLGQVFLTSVYLHVDNERERFTLWQAKPTTDEDLVAVQSASRPACNSTSTPGDQSGKVVPSASSTRPLSAGAIAGIVLGALFAVLAGLTLVFLCRRRKRGRAPRLATRTSSLQHDTHKEMVSTGWGPRHTFERVWTAPPRPGAGAGAVMGPHEVGGAQIHELHPGHLTTSPRYELAAPVD